MRRTGKLLAAGLSLALIGAGCGVAAFILWAWHSPLEALYVHDRPVTLDALVLLGGEGKIRKQRLFQAVREYTPRIVILSGAENAEQIAEELAAQGFPRSRIRVEAKATSTWENAAYSLPILEAANVRDVGLVTSWYHTRRSKRTFEHLAPTSIKFYAISTTEDLPQEPLGESFHLNRSCQREILKTAGYFFVHGIFPY